MSHQIPTLKALVNTIGDYVEKEHGTAVARTKLLQLFELLKKWQKAAKGGPALRWSVPEEILEFANEIMDAHGIEYVRPEGEMDFRTTGNKGASYVNTGDTYSGTLLYDEAKQDFYATTLGDFVEQAERRGRKFA